MSKHLRSKVQTTPTPDTASGVVEQRPNRQPSKLRKAGVIAALAVAGILGAATEAVDVAAGVVYHQAIGDILLHNDTPQEKQLGAALNTAYDTKRIQVRCEDPGYVTAIPGFTKEFPLEAPRLPAVGKGYPYTGTVWLTRKLCDNLTEIASRPHTAADFELFPSVSDGRPSHGAVSTHLAEQPTINPVVKDRLDAIRDVSHELGHAFYNTTNESEAECDAFQRVTDIARALGVSSSVSATLRDQTIALQEFEHETIGAMAPKFRFDSIACKDGGSGDLDLAHIGTFPTRP